MPIVNGVYVAPQQARSGAQSGVPSGTGLGRRPVIQRDWYDRTVGSGLYGLADTVRLLSNRIGRSTDIEWFNEVGRDLQGFMNRNPEYSPEEVSGFLDLIGDPGALTSNVAGSAGYTLASVGLAATAPVTAGVGLVLAAGLAYGVESQRAYESAIADGATKSEAWWHSNITGSISAGIEVLQVGKIIKFARGGKSALKTNALEKAYQISEMTGGQRFGKAGLEHAKFAAAQGLQEALQGSTDEFSANLIYGKEIEGGWAEFFDRRLTEGTIGAVAGEIFGTTGRALKLANSSLGGKQQDVFGPQDLYGTFRKDFGLNEADSLAATQLADRFVQNRAETEGLAPEQVWNQMFAKADSLDLQPNENATLYQIESRDLQSLPIRAKSAILKLGSKDGVMTRHKVYDNLQKRGVRKLELKLLGFGDWWNDQTKVTLESVKNQIDQFQAPMTAENIEPTESEFSEIDLDYAYDVFGEAVGKLETIFPNPWLRDTTPEGFIDSFYRFYTDSRGASKLSPEEFEQKYGPLFDDARAKARRALEIEDAVAANQRTYEEYVDAEVEGAEYGVQLINFNRGRFRTGHFRAAREKENNLLHVRKSDGQDFRYIHEIQSDWFSEQEKNKAKAAERALRDLEHLKDKVPDEEFKRLVDGLTKEYGPFEWDDPEYAKSVYLKATTQPYTLAELVGMAVNLNVWDTVRRHNFDYVILPTGASAQVGAGSATKESGEPIQATVARLAYERARKIAKQTGAELVWLDAGELRQRGVILRDPRVPGDQVTLDDQANPDVQEQIVNQLLALSSDPYRIRVKDKDGNVVRERDIRRELFFRPALYFPNPEVKRRVSDWGSKQTLFQLNEQGSTKASVQFTEDQRAILRATKSADFSSAIHELGHVFRRWMSPEDLQYFESAYGLKPGEWTRSAEERFAREFELYAFRGEAPVEGLRPIFDKIAENMRDIYETESAIPGSPRLSKQMSQKLGTMFWRHNSEWFRIADDIRLVDEQLEELPQINDTTATEEQLRKRSALEDRRETLMSQLAQHESSWWRPNGLLEREKAITSGLGMKNLNALAHSSMSSVANEFQNAKSWLGRTLLGMSTDLNTEAGQIITQKGDDINSDYLTDFGMFQQKLFKVLGSLKWKDNNWLSEVDENGISNLRKLADPGSVPKGTEIDPSSVSKRIRNLVKLLHEVNSYFGQEAERLGVLRLEGKFIRRFYASDTGKMLRMPTENMILLMKQIESGQTNAVHDALVDQINRLNPDLNLSKKEILTELKNWISTSVTRTVGPIEFGRNIKIMPDAIRIGERTLPLLHSNAQDVAYGSLRIQSMGLGFIRHFGQHKLQPGIPWRPSSIRRAGKPRKGLEDLVQILGLPSDSKTLRSMFKQAAIEELNHRGLEHISNTLIEDMGDQISDKALHKALKKQLKQHGVEIGSMNSVSAVHMLRNIKADEIPVELRDQIIQWSKEAQLGIREPGLGQFSRLSPERIQQSWSGFWSDLLERVSFKGQNIPQLLVQAHARAKGTKSAAQNATDALRVLQGMPLEVLGHSRPAQALKFTSSTIGALQTSMSAIPNVFQTPMQVPSITGLGNYLKALYRFITDTDNIKAEMAAIGVLATMPVQLQAEPGLKLEGLGRAVRTVSSLAFGQRYIGDMNQILAGGAAMEYIRQLETLPKLDSTKKRVLKLDGRLTDEEIQILENSQKQAQPFPDRIKRKFVQSVVAGTQFVLEAPHRKSRLQHSPIGRILFAYSDYGFGTARRTHRFYQEVRDVLKNKDFAAVPGLLNRISTMLVAGVGAGLASTIMRAVMQGRPEVLELPEDSEDLAGWIESGALALAEVQLFGPAMWFVGPSQYSSSSPEFLVSFFPQVSGITNMIGGLIGWGTHGAMPIGTRLQEGTKKLFPLYRGLDNTSDKLAFPYLSDYQTVRRRAQTWARENSERLTDPPTGGQLDPRYQRVFESVSRGDSEEAVRRTAEYLRESVEAGTEIDEALQKLRSSLMGRRPLTFSSERMLEYIETLDPDDADKQMRVNQTYLDLVDLIAPTSRRRRRPRPTFDFGLSPARQALPGLLSFRGTPFGGSVLR